MRPDKNKGDRRQRKPLLYSLRAKLILAMAIVLIIPMSITLFYNVTLFVRYIEGQVEEKVKDELIILSMAYGSKSGAIKSAAQFVAKDHPIVVVTMLRIKEQLADYINKMIKPNEIDMITITDPQGIVIEAKPKLKSFPTGLNSLNLLICQRGEGSGESIA